MRNHLRALREAREWTQAGLADRLGVSRQTVNALETGKYDPSLPLAFRIARLFDAPIESIFEPEEEARTDAGVRPGR
ncbi:putative transcriptional regulator [Nakamurella flavida]|uniref:helix-turn-helix transcriptional regulator n=1 Tax=Nakamurella flavida TaxID=363630 RepID=UPI00277E8629|nr:helix-turn-helix transcriptional regulator [Nakamurella flavida]MDP9778443.1 putative transcriptional regulator [Nakamurella flavida]